MTLTELAEAYRLSAAGMTERIARLRLELAAGGRGAQERCRLSRRVEMLAGMQRELRATAAYLEHYYDGRRGCGRAL